jgi:hypothetical protein
MTNDPLVIIPELIIVIRRYPQSWIPALRVRELHTSSGIPRNIMTWLVLLFALPAPFIFASTHLASHVVAAFIFLDQAVATGACLEFLIATIIVQLSNYVIIGHLNVADLSFVHFQLAFEADHSLAFLALDLGGLRVWCAYPFLTV